MSVDRELILKSIYDPIFPARAAELRPVGSDGRPVVRQHPVRGLLRPGRRRALLTENGWAKGADGYWAKDGAVPTIRWTINTGNKRREDTQALMLPIFNQLGFKVVADNTDADTLFQKRLPALDYDLGMFIQTVAGSLGDQHHALRPGPFGWRTTTRATARPAGATRRLGAHDAVGPGGRRDRTGRSDPPGRSGAGRRRGAAAVPVPEHRAWRTDQLSGPIDADAGNYRSASTTSTSGPAATS